MGKLYLVGTPIGNLQDLTLRATEVLKEVDFIAAEDTRVSKKILNYLNIVKPMVSYYEHNRRARGEEILKRIQTGETCALVTDAGMPAISDPGEDLVAICAENGIEVLVIPGPCAAICALAVSGLPSGRWCFEGFLSTAKKSRREHLDALKTETRTMIFYEAPHKLKATLQDFYTIFGDRRIALSRELTKIHEECLRMTLSEAVAYYETVTPKGEFVLIVEGAPVNSVMDEFSLEKAYLIVEKFVDNGETWKDSVKLVSSKAGIKKNTLYQYVLNKQKNPQPVDNK